VPTFPVPGLRAPSAQAVPPEHLALAGPDSRFVLFEGVLLHYTVHVRSDAAAFIASTRAAAGACASGLEHALAGSTHASNNEPAAASAAASKISAAPASPSSSLSASLHASAGSDAADANAAAHNASAPAPASVPPPPPALVLHHGFGSSLFSFLPTLGALLTPTVTPLNAADASFSDAAAATAAVAAGRAVLAPGASAVLCFDRPGFGLSGRPQEAEIAARERARATRLREQGAVERERSRLSALYGHSLRANAATRALLSAAFAPESSPYHVDFATRATFALMQAHGLDLLGAVVGGHHSGAAVVVRTALADADAVAELESTAAARNSSSAGGSGGAGSSTAVASAGAAAGPGRVRRLVRGVLLLAPSLYEDGFPQLLRSLFRTGLGRSMVHQLLRSEVGDVALRRSWFRPSAIPPEVVALNKAFARLPHWHAAFLVMAATPSPNEALVARLGEIACPVLLVHGEQDKIVPPVASGKTARALTGSESVELARVPACGHCPQEEQAELFVAYTAAFIRAVAMQGWTLP